MKRYLAPILSGAVALLAGVILLLLFLLRQQAPSAVLTASGETTHVIELDALKLSLTLPAGVYVSATPAEAAIMLEGPLEGYSHSEYPAKLGYITSAGCPALRQEEGGAQVLTANGKELSYQPSSGLEPLTSYSFGSFTAFTDAPATEGDVAYTRYAHTEEEFTLHFAHPGEGQAPRELFEAIVSSVEVVERKEIPFCRKPVGEE